jgi:hypothetical protein
MKRSMLWLSLVIAACESPYDPPPSTTMLEIALDSATIPKTQFLPPHVNPGDPGGPFVLVLPGVVLNPTLGELCTPCVALDGQTAAKPAFSDTIAANIALPENVLDATIVGGGVRFSVQHDFGFDLLHPGEEFGALSVRFGAGSQPIGRQTFSHTFMSGGMFAIYSAFAIDNAAVPPVASSGLRLEVLITSPTGTPTIIKPASTLRLNTVFVRPLVSSVVVHISERQVTAPIVMIELRNSTEIEADQVRGGTLRMDITNPFQVSGMLAVSITGAGTPISKTATLAAGNSVIDVNFTEAEMRQMVGQQLNLNVSGTVAAASGVTVTPSDNFVIKPRLIVEIESDN